MRSKNLPEKKEILYCAIFVPTVIILPLILAYIELSVLNTSDGGIFTGISLIMMTLPLQVAHIVAAVGSGDLRGGGPKWLFRSVLFACVLIYPVLLTIFWIITRWIFKRLFNER